MEAECGLFGGAARLPGVALALELGFGLECGFAGESGREECATGGFSRCGPRVVVSWLWLSGTLGLPGREVFPLALAAQGAA